MTRGEDARRAALDAFRKSIDVGADLEVALDVAVARYRAVDPLADEYRAKAVVAKIVADEEGLPAQRVSAAPERPLEPPEAD